MESKGNKSSSAFLFGLSVNLILTLGSLGYTCYSLNRLDSRLTTVEQDLLVVSHPEQLTDREIVKPKFTHSPPSGSRRKEVVAKRAVDRSSMCTKCICSCFNANRSLNVSCLSLCYDHKKRYFKCRKLIRLGDLLSSGEKLSHSLALLISSITYFL